MPATITYLLQVNVAILAFYLLYHLVFRSLTFYRLNRCFLLFGLLFALLYPLIDLPQLFVESLPASDGYGMALYGWPSGDAEAPALQPAYWTWIKLLLVGFSFLQLLRLVLKLFSLYSFHVKTKPATAHGFSFRKTSERVNPFSFWKSIYLNPGCHEKEELKAILQHEKVHIKEFHTLDILLAEVMLVFCWFSPAMWYTSKAICDNLEFMTDQQLLQKGMESRTYQYYLLKNNTRTQTPSLAFNFNFSTIKTRISMMNRRRSSPLHMLKYALMVPLVSSLLYACNLEDEPVAKLLPREQNTSGLPPATEASYYLDGKVSSREEVSQLPAEEIAAINIIKGENALSTFGKKGVVVVATTKGKQGPDLLPTGKEVTSSADPMKDAYILIDGKEASTAEMKSLAPDQIAKMDVWKGQKAIEQYGSKAENGAISITTKE